MKFKILIVFTKILLKKVFVCFSHILSYSHLCSFETHYIQQPTIPCHTFPHFSTFIHADPPSRMPLSSILHVEKSYESFKRQLYEAFLLFTKNEFIFFFYVFISSFTCFSFMRILILCLPHCDIGQKLCVVPFGLRHKSLSLIFITHLIYVE